jgi:hypothetical protein
MAWRCRSVALILGLTLLVACGSEKATPLFAPTDPAGRLFEPGHIVEVALEVAPGDWETLRRQTRVWWDIAAAENKACMDEPFHKPFDWYKATITVDGVKRSNVAVRKKGFLGSLNAERPALKISFDKYDSDQTLLGLDRLTLNNAVQDPTWLKQCLAYRVFEKAGVPVPWCNFAHVTVNGRDLGLYVHVESFDRRWVRRHWERDEGDLWEGELSDFRRGWLDTFEKKGDVPEEDQRKANRAALANVGGALEGFDDTVREQLSELIDFDGFMRFWAVEKVLEHWDGYSNNMNNYVLYRDPATEKFHFAPSGTDQITVEDPFATPKPPVSVYAVGSIAQRLYQIPATRDLYAATLREVLDQAFREDDLLAEIDRMQALVAPVIARSGPSVAAAQALAVEELRKWVRGRRAVLLADLAGGPPQWAQPPKQSICVDLAGSIQVAFGTTFGTNQEPDAFRTGSGAVAGVYRRTPLSVGRVGAAAGLDKNDPEDPWTVVDIVAEATDGRLYTIWLGLNPERLAAGDTRGSFDDGFAWGGIGVWNPSTYTWTFMGGFVAGKVELDQAGQTPGAPLSGRFEGLVIQW